MATQQRQQPQITADEIEHRFGFHKATESTGPRHGDMREAFKLMAHVIVNSTKPGREQSLALTALQETSMWTHAAIAMDAPLVEG